MDVQLELIWIGSQLHFCCSSLWLIHSFIVLVVKSEVGFLIMTQQNIQRLSFCNFNTKCKVVSSSSSSGSYRGSGGDTPGCIYHSVTVHSGLADSQEWSVESYHRLSLHTFRKGTSPVHRGTGGQRGEGGSWKCHHRWWMKKRRLYWSFGTLVHSAKICYLCLHLCLHCCFCEYMDFCRFCGSSSWCHSVQE